MLRKRYLFVTLILLISLIPGSVFLKAESGVAIKKCIINGKISLPKGMKADKDTPVTIYFYNKNRFPNNYLAFYTAYIRAGSNTAVYSLGVDLNSEGYIGYCYENEETGFWNKGFYSSSGTTFNYKKARLMKIQKTSYSNINLQLIKSRKINGKVRLPNLNEIATHYCSCTVIPVHDNETPKNLSDDIDIPQESGAVFNLSKEASYSITIPDVKASYRIKYKMEYGYPFYGGYPFINEGYYAKTGATADYDRAAVININGSYSGPVNFTVLEAGKIEGKIYIEGGKKAAYDIIVELENGENPTYGHGYGAVIEKGETSAEYRLYFQDLKHKHIVTVVDNLKPIYYFGGNKLVKDKSSAKQFDLSKGNIEGFDVAIPDGIRLQNIKPYMHVVARRSFYEIV